MPHDANYWAAWAAAGSAAAACFNLVGILYSAKSAKAAEIALTLPVKASMVVIDPALGEHEAVVTVRNFGPGSASGLMLWKSLSSTTVFNGRYESKQEALVQAMNCDGAKGIHYWSHLAPGGMVTTVLPDFVDDSHYVLDWTDVTGNAEQLHFVVSVSELMDIWVHTLGAVSHSREKRYRAQRFNTILKLAPEWVRRIIHYRT